ITDTTIFYISSLTCPNGCSDFIGLGNQVVFVYNQAPVIDDPGDLEGCGSVVLPPITGMNIPGDAAYYTQPNGGGTAYLPGQTVNFSGTLYLFADNGGCVDEVSVMVNVDSGFDPAWTAPAGLCSNDGP
ncbi:MAG: hypothetical protein KDC43_25815, partial [Saprospiraceae bacterium]|nr:hypothetical protein [Saprospiraceae bacterium]